MNKILIVNLLIGLFLIGSVSVISYNHTQNNLSQQEQTIIIQDPKTGETWNSIEDFKESRITILNNEIKEASR